MERSYYIAQQPTPPVVVQTQPSPPFWQQLILAIVAGGLLTTVVVKGFDLAFKWLNQRSKSGGLYSVFLQVTKVYDHLERMKAGINAQRVLIVRAHNGGNVLTPQSQLYASILYEVYDAAYESIKEFWMKREVGQDYLRLLQSIHNEPYVHLTTDQVSPDVGILAGFSADEKACTFCVKVQASAEAFLYLVCVFADCPCTADGEKERIAGELLDHSAALKNLLEGKDGRLQ